MVLTAVHIALLFTEIVMRGAVPDSCLYNTNSQRRHGDVSDNSNFRDITLEFDKRWTVSSTTFVLSRYGDLLASPDLQFGFKAKSSTNLRSMVMKESLAYHVNHQSSILLSFFACFKGMDRVRYCKLFKLFVGRQVPAPIVRYMLNFYTGNLVRVQWCDSTCYVYLAEIRLLFTG